MVGPGADRKWLWIARWRVGRGRASSHMHYGQALINRLPKLGAAFAAGDVDFRVVAVAVYRTDLITDADAVAKVDDELARRRRA
ncbi:MAG: DUF222 domain-containing protein, partial [Mycobacterium sp.]